MERKCVSKVFQPATVLLTLAAIALLLGGQQVYAADYVAGVPEGSTSGIPYGNSSGDEFIAENAGECWSECWAQSSAYASKAGEGSVSSQSSYYGTAECSLTYTWSGAPGTGPGGDFETTFGGDGHASTHGYYITTPSPAGSPSSPPPNGYFIANASAQGWATDDDGGYEDGYVSVSQNQTDSYTLSGSNSGSFSGDTFTIYTAAYCSTGAIVNIWGKSGWYAYGHGHGIADAYTDATCEITIF